MAFEETCSPPNNCMFNPSDGAYHRCANPASLGKCMAFEEACSP
jgi:hypothetical protein